MSQELIWSNQDDSEVESDVYSLQRVLHGLFKTRLIKIIASKWNWQGQIGEKVVNIYDNHHNMYSNIVPKHECQFNLYKDENSVYAIVYSHDAPTGSRWIFLEYEGEQ